MSQKTSPAVRSAILVVWIAGFLIGTTAHIFDLIAGDLRPYTQFPALLRLFWVSLTVLDPLAAVLLALRRRAGIVLALAIILADITVNWTVFISIDGNPLFGVVNQTLFAGILLTTAPVLWRWFPARAA